VDGLCVVPEARSVQGGEHVGRFGIPVQQHSRRHEVGPHQGHPGNIAQDASDLTHALTG
jgi:hypothetical protein